MQDNEAETFLLFSILFRSNVCKVKKPWIQKTEFINHDYGHSPSAHLSIVRSVLVCLANWHAQANIFGLLGEQCEIFSACSRVVFHNCLYTNIDNTKNELHTYIQKCYDHSQRKATVKVADFIFHIVVYSEKFLEKNGQKFYGPKSKWSKLNGQNNNSPLKQKIIE